MAKDPRKRDREKARKAEKQRRKAIEHARERKGVLDQGRNMILASKIGSAVGAPLHDCRVSEDLFEAGLGQATVSRQLPGGNLGVGVFLVDIQCLGIKDAFYRVVSTHEYKTRYVEGNPMHPLVTVEPAYARKLVEEAHAYADSLGLQQSPEYAPLIQLFGDIDPLECKERFEFGRNGKPFFTAGPFDPPSFCQRVIDQLTARLGRDGFDYILPM